MAIQNELITVTIGGGSANPKTIMVPVSIDTTTGSGTASFSYVGSNPGSDSITASLNIGGNIYTSNVASVNWQATNGLIQMGGPVTCYAWTWAASNQTGSGYNYGWSPGQLPLNTATAVGTGNAISFDTYATTANSTTIPQWYTLSATGENSGSQSFPPYKQDFDCIISGNLVVPASGSYTMSLNAKDNSLWGIGSSLTGVAPTWSGKGTFTGPAGQTTTVNGGFPLLPPVTGNGDANPSQTASSIVTFVSPGIYPIETDWNYFYHSDRILHATVNGAEICPVDLTAVPATSAAIGNLVITPSGGLTNLAIQGSSITLTLQVTGIQFTYTHYVPVYEGASGSLYISNQSLGGESFTFQSYNGQTPTPALAVADVFQLSGDNIAYQGLISVTTDGTYFYLAYNGGTPPGNTATTTLTLTADDVAWYDATSGALDLYSATATGTTSIEFDYMIKPNVVSVVSNLSVSASPTTSSTQPITFTVTLESPLSPQQQGAYGTGNAVTATATLTNSTSACLVTNNTALGWLTGWTVTTSIPTSTTNATYQLSMDVTGTLTYLQGTELTLNQSMNYFSGAVGAPITIIGSSATPPVPHLFTVTPTTPNTSPIVIPTACTLTAVVYTLVQDAVTLQFVARTNGNQIILNPGVLVSSLPGNIGGNAVYMSTFQLSGVSPATFYGTYLGYTATDTVNQQSVTWFSASEYVGPASQSTVVQPSGGV